MIAAIVIWIKPEYHLADPICTFLFSILVMVTTINIVRECIVVLMEGSPVGLNIREFKENMMLIEGVIEIHDLHIWSISIGKPAMSAHILSSKPLETLKKATNYCRKFGIYHSTLQVEYTDDTGKLSVLNCDHNIHN